MKIHANSWKSMFHANPWKSMLIHENPCSMLIHENPCSIRKSHSRTIKWPNYRYRQTRLKKSVSKLVSTHRQCWCRCEFIHDYWFSVGFWRFRAGQQIGLYSPPKNRPEPASTGTNRPLRTRIWILMKNPVVLSGLGMVLRCFFSLLFPESDERRVLV